MLNTLDVTKYIAACAKRAGVHVVWEGAEATPRTDGRTMWLPRVNAYSPIESAVKLRQFVKHETSHILYSDFDLLNKNRPAGLLAFVNNLLEDHRIDYLNDSEYAGDKGNTESYMLMYAKEVSEHPVAEEAKATMVPLFAWDLSVREDLWCSMPCPFTPHLNEEGQRILDKLNAGDYAAVLRNIRNIEDATKGGEAVWELACRIIREVFDASPEKMVDKGGSKGKKGKGGEGKGEKAEGDSDVSVGEGGEAMTTDRLVDIDFEGAMAMPYSDHLPKGEGVNARNYACGEGEVYTPTPYDEIREVNFVTNTARNGTIPKNEVSEGWLDKHVEKSVSLSNQVRTQLQIISRDRWEYGKKKGRLHNSALYRVSMRDSKGLNERLFKQRIENVTLDVSVQVLVDASGSMSGSKFENAAAAAVILNQVIGNTLNIPLEILAFTEWDPIHTMFVMKEFDKPATAQHLDRAFGCVSGELMDNVDGESFVYGYNRIRNRKEKRKLMIVLSDGSPCGGRRKGDIIKYTRRVIKNIEATDVELIGVGLMYDAVKSYYKKWAVIPAAKDIEFALLNLISQHIIRRV